MSGKLVEQGVATKYTGKIAGYLAGHSDSESVSRAWEDLSYVIVNAADTVLGRTERVKHKNWFDEEYEQVTNLKHQAYKRMQQKNYTRGVVAEYREARREEIECIKRIKGIMINKK
jgi:predicted methyltransferase